MVRKGTVLSVQNVSCETLGTLEQLLTRDGYEIEHILAGRDSVPTDPSAYSALIILGGPMAVYDKLEYLERESALVQTAIDKNIPLLGVCLGSQIIAQAMGGRVYKGEKKEIGWDNVTITEDGRKGLFKGMGHSLNVFHWHGDTYDLPRGARILARSARYIQSFQISSAIGVQFHLEVNVDLIKSWIREYRAEMDSEGLAEQNLMGGPLLAEQLSHSCHLFYENFAREMLRKNGRTR